ncbi:CatB-related O-acetyltransferase [Shewanella sp. SR44-3]|uniref:CatB-related O-acetyltransferase n=1 Tax=Shewanella sp. SR44-3 TaxID=2760936 RepID=UPI0015FB4E26|nr:CatB-related O-acetyltransferase [Shewanella sp. SR44-3]MBB1269289.1 CatB-related O-acetyltransferase [Shewanella sp. SR44-3]
MKLKQLVRDFLVVLKSNYYKKLNKSSIFADKTILFKKIDISHSSIGKYTYFAGKGTVSNAIIGSYCSIADGVKIGIGLHPLDWVSTHPSTFSSNTIFPYRHFSRSKPFIESETVTIGNDVWIGLNAIILDGVVVGNGAVIAAGSIVTKNVDDYAIVAGVPAKIIKYRTQPELTNIPWWELDDTSLNEYLSKVDDSHV